MHLKRNKIGKFWPVERKGTKYLTVSAHNQNESIPLVVVMRDVLKIVRNKKELQRLINEKSIKINQKEIKETNYPVSLFDTINLLTIKKNYQAILSKNKKMIFEEISEKDAETKIFKVINKKILPGKKIQLNLLQGKNIISKEKIQTGNSLVLNLKDNVIKKIIPIVKGSNVFVMKGKHMGVKGKIESIEEEGGKEIAKISSDKEKINVWTKNIIAIE